jgi:hypothetical protein
MDAVEGACVHGPTRSHSSPALQVARRHVPTKSSEKSQLLVKRHAVQHLAIAEMSTASTGQNPRKSEHFRGIANCLVLVLSRVGSGSRSPARSRGIDEDRRKGWVL